MDGEAVGAGRVAAFDALHRRHKDADAILIRLRAPSTSLSLHWDHASARVGANAVPVPHSRHQDALALSSSPPRITKFDRHLVRTDSSEVDMQDPVTKAEHYRKAANKYGEMAKQAEADYMAEIYRKVAVRYIFMAEDLLNWSERRRELDVNALAGAFLDRQAA
jgi:hypothetical protein